MTTTLIHIIGPQGSGKSLLARFIVAGMPAQHAAVHVDAEAASELSNSELRRRYSGRTVVLEAAARQSRHADLADGDMVLVLERGSRGRPCAAQPQEATHGAC